MHSGEERLNREGRLFSALKSISVRGDHDGRLREQRENCLLSLPVWKWRRVQGVSSGSGR